MNRYVCSDLHGMKELYDQIKKFLKPDDIVIYLGDAGDRGPQAWELIKEIYKDNQFVYIRGNHEQMLIDAIFEFQAEELPGDNFYLLANNGGAKTFEGWMNEEENIRTEWYKRLNQLPYWAEYTNDAGIRIMMTHAGFTPMYDYNDEIAWPDDQDCMWDRHHFNDPWPVETEDVIIIHGHTPIPYLMNADRDDFPFGAFWYSGNHKIDIDNAAFATGVTVLLNLDTFEEHLFYTEEAKKKYSK